MPAANFTTDVRFQDSDLFSETAREWQADFIQLDRGSFSALIRQIGRKGIQLGEASLSRRVQQAGLAPPGGRTFIIQKVPLDDFIWKNARPKANEMLCYPSGSEFESVSPAGFHIYGLSVPWWMVEEKAAALEYPVNASLHLGLERVEIPVQSMALIRRELSELMGWLEPIQRGIPGSVEEYEERLEEVTTTVILAWLRGSSDDRPALSLCRERIVTSALDHILAHEREALTVQDLCQATGASERTVQYAFREKFQVTPKQYLTARRLDGVRRELRSAGGPAISEVAQTWGFRHMGQFSAKFRNAFGELPSATRSRKS